MIVKDKRILEHIRDYCNDIQATVQRFGDNKENFIEDRDYRNSICMSFLQIGELEGLLSEEFRSETKGEIPWSAIRQTRNIVAHHYGAVSTDIIWDAMHEDISVLKSFCEKYIQC